MTCERCEDREAEYRVSVRVLKGAWIVVAFVCIACFVKLPVGEWGLVMLRGGQGGR